MIISNDFQTVIMITTFLSVWITFLSMYMNYYIKNETLNSVTISLLYFSIAFLVIDIMIGFIKMVI